jgi:apolipoprotein N-acyltransferase
VINNGFLLKKIAPVCINVLLILVAALFYALSFPNFISEWGFAPLAFIALFPMFIVIQRARWFAVPLYGILFSVVAHLLFNYWLVLFNPVALTVVLTFRALTAIFLFLLLKLAAVLFPRMSALVQSAIWTGFEFLCAQGFLAYSYGILGYSQFLFIPFLQLASVTAVWGLSYLVILPAAYLGNSLKDGFKRALPFLKKTFFIPVVWSALFVVIIIFGLFSQTDTENLHRFRAACIQPNIDPWKGGDAAYEKTLSILIRLSREALQQNPDLVIWPETAVVPSIRLHTRLRYDQERYNRVIRPFLEFMDTQAVPYLIGNNDREITGKDNKGNYLIKDYNSALFLFKREILGVYRKTHLVPFTEYFPYQDGFPGIYQWLRNQDTHFYEPGNDQDADFVFSRGPVRFSTPICFEDTFGEISRRFVNNGAAVLINLSNDAWSHSVVAEIQHLGIAVFRAVENRRSLIRCTTSGLTAVIDPNGRIISLLSSFEPLALVSDVVINENETTLCARWGDWCPILLLIAAAGFLVFGLLRRVLKIRQKGN